ncbi:DUF4291 family protein [Streptomyces sp. NPDC102394]|uniref:DUF4291 family protein n=1 Tax=Streptomyces sp. NPDC102394 TaxID=3366167 RepID=UPI0038080239
MTVAARADSLVAPTVETPKVCDLRSGTVQGGDRPSFLWMMYRRGWATKPGQETVLAVEIARDGFEWALRNACLSSYVRGLHPDLALVTSGVLDTASGLLPKETPYPTQGELLPHLHG